MTMYLNFNLKIVERTHPALFLACKMIADDNGLHADHWEMDERWTTELTRLEQEAKLLTELPASKDWEHDSGATALNDFSVGEFTIQQDLCERYGLSRLMYFLGCFFGELDYVEPGREQEGLIRSTYDE